MERKEFLISWLRRLALIHGFTMMMLYVICRLVNAEPDIDVAFLGNMILFSLAGTLPGMIYYTNHELSEREWWVRTGIHFVLLNLLLLPISHAIGLWQGPIGCVTFIALILIVDVLVHLVSYGMDWATARNINKLLIRNREANNGSNAE